jgi:hypothetical protein
MDWKVSFIFQYPEFFREKKMIYKLATHGFIWHGPGARVWPISRCNTKQEFIYRVIIFSWKDQIDIGQIV